MLRTGRYFYDVPAIGSIEPEPPIGANTCVDLTPVLYRGQLAEGHAPVRKKGAGDAKPELQAKASKADNSGASGSVCSQLASRNSGNGRRTKGLATVNSSDKLDQHLEMDSVGRMAFYRCHA